MHVRFVLFWVGKSKSVLADLLRYRQTPRWQNLGGGLAIRFSQKNKEQHMSSVPRPWAELGRQWRGKWGFLPTRRTLTRETHSSYGTIHKHGRANTQNLDHSYKALMYRETRSFIPHFWFPPRACGGLNEDCSPPRTPLAHVFKHLAISWW